MEVAGQAPRWCVRRSYPAMDNSCYFGRVGVMKSINWFFSMNPTADLTVPSGHQYGQLRDGADLKHAGEFGRFVDID